jgi:beta-glucosidase
MTLGIQDEGVVSTLKHFAVYSVPKGGRDGDVRTDPQVTPRDVDSIYFDHFRRGIIDCGSLGVMSSYNDYNGIPITGNSKFLTDILRNSWGFQGYVVSDSGAVEQIWDKHHVTEDFEHAVAEAVNAGLNVWTNFREPEDFIDPLRNAVKSGLISMDVINERVRDVLRVKYILGIFDKPYIENIEQSDQVVHSEEHQQVALEAARESIVLLKNKDNLLPLNDSIKRILVTGPLANDTKNLSTGYGPIIDIEPVYEAIKKKFGDRATITYSKGCEVIDNNFPNSEILPETPDDQEQKMINEAVEKAVNADVIIAVIGEDDRIVGESHSRTSLDLDGHQLDLVKALFDTGKPIVVVLLNGRPISINWINENIPAIIEGCFPGEKTGQAIAEVLSGDYNPGGKLPLTFPKSVGQVPLNFPYKPSSQAGGSTYVSGVLYPFGYGLSYTEFEYSNLEVSPKQIDKSGAVTISVEVTNTGKVKGDEVVQVYISDKVSSVTTYEKELKGFYRVTLLPNQTKRIKFSIPARELSLLNRSMERVVEPGEFEVLVGSSSEDIRLKENFYIIGDM